MQTRIINLSEDFNGGIAEGARVILDGGLVAFPTETVYGLGALAQSPAAVRGIFAAKGRPGDNPLIVHVASIEMAKLLAREWPPEARALAAAFWPGPLTLVLPRANVPDEVTAGLDSVAIRMPNNEAALALIRASGPLAAPSANKSGRPSPTRAEHVLSDLGGKIGLILDGGPCEIGVESTVLSLVDKPTLLRPGGVTPAMLQAILGKGAELDQSVLRPLGVGETAASPGMKYRHYAPKSEVIVVGGKGDELPKKIIQLYDEQLSLGKTCVILGSIQSRHFYAGRDCVIIGDRENPATFCANLFDALRAHEGAQVMLIEALEPENEGLAFMNRALRAAGFKCVNCAER